MVKTIYQIKQIIPNDWNLSNGVYEKCYRHTKELNSFNDVKKFLSTKSLFTIACGSDVFKNGKLIFHTSNFDEVRTTENLPLTLKNVIENFKVTRG